MALYALRGGSYDLVIRQELGVAVWWILLLGLALGVLPRARPSSLALIPLLGLAGLLAVTALGLTVTESDERTVNEIARVLHYGGLVLLALCLVDAGTWRAAAAGLLAGAVVVSLLALGMSAHARGAAARALALAPVPAVIAVAYLTYARGGVVAVAVGLVALVVLVPFRGLLLVHALVAALGSAGVILVIRSHPDIARGEGSSGALVVLLVVLAAAAVCAVVAWASGAVDLGSRLRLPSRIARALAIATGVAVLAVAVVAGPSLADRALDELRRPAPSSQAADPAARLSSLGSARADVWEAALDIYRAEPSHGTGPGTFEFAWNRSPRYSEFVRDGHSIYLEALAEEGWPGLVAVLVFLGGLLFAGVRLRMSARRDPVVAGGLAALLATFVVYLAYAGYDWMWELTAVSMFGLVAGCIVLGSAGRWRATAPAWPVRVLLAVVALIAGLTQLPGLVSTAEVRTSQAEVRAGNLEAAMTDAEDAVASAPWAATPYVQRALLLERQGRLRVAEADVARARELEPTNYRHPLLLARLEALQGNVRPALAAFREARRLAPKKRIVEGGPQTIAPRGP